MIRTIVNYIRIQRILKQIYKTEHIEQNLSQLFGVPCKQDWVGRLYMIINPILQNIESNGNALTLDRNNKVLIEEWVMKNLELIRNFVVNNSMFDLLTYSIERIDDDENYLVVFKNVYFDDMKRVCKWLAILIPIIIVGIIVALKVIL